MRILITRIAIKYQFAKQIWGGIVILELSKGNFKSEEITSL